MLSSFKQLADWTASLPTGPKLAISMIIICVAGFLLTLIWRDFSSIPAEVDTQIQSDQQNGALLRAIFVSTSVGIIRQEYGVSRIEPRHEGRNIGKIPNKKFGFTPAWMLNTDPTGIVGGTGVEKIHLMATAMGTAVLEIHKLERGDFRIIASLDENSSTLLEDPSRKTPCVVTLVCQDPKELERVVSIPVERILEWDCRSVRGKTLVDAVIL